MRRTKKRWKRREGEGKEGKGERRTERCKREKGGGEEGGRERQRRVPCHQIGRQLFIPLISRILRATPPACVSARCYLPFFTAASSLPQPPLICNHICMPSMGRSSESRVVYCPCPATCLLPFYFLFVVVFGPKLLLLPSLRFLPLLFYLLDPLLHPAAYLLSFLFAVVLSNIPLFLPSLRLLLLLLLFLHPPLCVQCGILSPPFCMSPGLPHRRRPQH